MFGVATPSKPQGIGCTTLPLGLVLVRIVLLSGKVKSVISTVACISLEESVCVCVCMCVWVCVCGCGWVSVCVGVEETGGK